MNSHCSGHTHGASTGHARDARPSSHRSPLQVSLMRAMSPHAGCPGCAADGGLAGVKVGAAGDPHEREADAVANAVTSGGSVSLEGGGAAKTVQRTSPRASSGGSASLPGLGAGAPLSSATRAALEPKMGYDFSSVRVHSGAAAADANRAVGAKAFAYGNHIALGAGVSESDTRVMAHELTHVAQQGSASPMAGGTIQRLLATGGPSLQRLMATGDGAMTAMGGLDVSSAPLAVRFMGRASDHASAAPTTSSTGSPGATSGHVAHTSAADADRLIQAELGRLVTGLRTGSVAVGKVSVVDGARFAREYTRYFGPDDHDEPITNAFVERDSSQALVMVWVHQDRGNPGTVIHESVHMYSNVAWKNTYGFNANEGVTEYFTRIVTTSQNMPARNNYQEEYDAVVALVGRTTQAVLGDAYFNGNIAGIRTAVGATRFDGWATQMRAGDYAAAVRALA